jgi:hypothetical protein
MSLAEIVPDTEYRATFLRMTKSCTSGQQASFDQVEFRQAGALEDSPIILRSETQQGITKLLRKQTQRHPETETLFEEVQIQGILRNLSLDNDWLEVVTHEGMEQKKYRIMGTGEAVDDVIGPMVNKVVIVDSWRVAEDKYRFRDIRPAG